MSTKISHEDYLKNTLQSAKSKLKELEIQDRINTEIFDTKRDMLINQIDSIEKQLETHK